MENVPWHCPHIFHIKVLIYLAGQIVSQLAFIYTVSPVIESELMIELIAKQAMTDSSNIRLTEWMNAWINKRMLIIIRRFNVNLVFQRKVQSLALCMKHRMQDQSERPECSLCKGLVLNIVKLQNRSLLHKRVSADADDQTNATKKIDRKKKKMTNVFFFLKRRQSANPRWFLASASALEWRLSFPLF